VSSGISAAPSTATISAPLPGSPRCNTVGVPAGEEDSRQRDDMVENLAAASHQAFWLNAFRILPGKSQKVQTRVEGQEDLYR